MISPIEASRPAMAYLHRIGASMKSLFTASIVVEAMGYQKDVVTIRFNRQGKVMAPSHVAPTDSEASAIEADILTMEFPNQVTLAALSNSDMPDLIRNATEDQLYIFRDMSKHIRFIQVRIELDNGDKRYVPQTYWSDGQWRMAEPEDGLPIYNVDQVYTGARVFVHEGAKAARAATEIAKDPSHPWQEYFDTGVHVGWIGGAHHLHRNLWREISFKPGEVIVVPDNDFVSKFRVKELSRKFHCPVYQCRLDSKWPKSWDVADPMPESFFSPDSGIYQGPMFEDLLTSCVWATEMVEVDGAPRPVAIIREEFAQSWVRIQKIRHYADLRNPEITLDKEQFNVQVRPYSDVEDTAAVMARASGNICDTLTFMPDLPSGLVSIDGQMCLNQYVDRRIKPYRKVDTTPFWDFMEYMFPEETERNYVANWMATLYARPEVRMNYGLLLLSKMQGVGKSTLLEIMAEMVGRKHVSFPGDAVIQSDFNGWAINKRLVVVHEIYAGQNWKTYNRLKSLITDTSIEANNKHVANYTIPNWTHYAAASNSMEALRMEHDDRRWLVPKLPETLYNDYGGLIRWIRSGGLRSLAAEFMEWDRYVTAGDRAPQTLAKLALIDQSMPVDERMILVLCERMPQDNCLDVKDIWLWLQSEVKTRAYVTPQRISTLLREHGYQVDAPINIGSRRRELIWRSLEDRRKVLDGMPKDDLIKKCLERLQEPSQVFQSDHTM